MFYYAFAVSAMLVTLVAIFNQYTITKEETEVAVKAKSILNNVETIEKVKANTEIENSIILRSVYELKLPLSNYLIKDSLPHNTINVINNLQEKTKAYLAIQPLGVVTCGNLSGAGLLSTEELTACNEIDSGTYHFIEDNSKGLKYTLEDEKINEKLTKNFNDSSSITNKVVDSNVYMFKNYSNHNVSIEKIKQIITLIDEKKNEKKYIDAFKIIQYLHEFSQEKAINETETFIKLVNNGKYILSEIEKKQLIKTIIPMVITTSDEKLFSIVTTPELAYFLEQNKSFIENIGLLLGYNSPSTLYTKIKS